jgi:glycosyltransferase 2 family protein
VIRAVTLVGLAGLAAATALFVWHGVAPVLAAFVAAGLGIVWSSLFHVVSMALNARAWQVLLPGRRRHSLLFFLWAVWLREAVNGLLPVARIGGEVVSGQLLIRHGLRPVMAVASLVVDMTVSLLSQFTFTLLGLALLVARGAGGGLVQDVALGLLATLPACSRCSPSCSARCSPAASTLSSVAPCRSTARCGGSIAGGTPCSPASPGSSPAGPPAAARSG